MLSESDLCASNIKKEVEKVAKAYPEFKELLLELAENKDIKSERNRLIAEPGTPKSFNKVLKKIKVEHNTFYKLMKTTMGSKLDRAKENKKDLDKKGGYRQEHRH